MVEVVGTAPTSVMVITKFVYRRSCKTTIISIYAQCLIVTKKKYFMYFKYFICILLKKIARFLPNSSKLNELLNFFLIILIGSNHSRRINNLNKSIKNIRAHDFEYIKFKSFYPKNNFKQISVFIGDSHGEFYGRNFNLNKDIKNFFLTYHTGATLLATVGTSENLIKKIFNFIKFFKYYNLKKDHTLNIIFSFGEIDVRNFYYQALKIDKSFKNEKKLTNFIVDCFSENFLNLKKILKKNNFKKVKFFFKDITPTTYSNNYNPKNNIGLEKIRYFHPSPVIGSLKQRVYWRNILSNQVKIMCKRNNINFIHLKKTNFAKNGSINKLKTFDHFHISNLELLEDVQTKIK